MRVPPASMSDVMSSSSAGITCLHSELDEDKAVQYTTYNDADCSGNDIIGYEISSLTIDVCFQRCNEYALYKIYTFVDIYVPRI